MDQDACGAIYKPRREASGETNPASTLTSDVQPPECEKFSFFVSAVQSVLLFYGSQSRLTVSRTLGIE